MSQVGGNWALTTAHCLYSRETGMFRPTASIKVLPGLHHRSRPKFALRWAVGRGGVKILIDSVALE